MRVAYALDAVEFAGAERYLEVLLAGLDVSALVVMPAAADPEIGRRLSVHAEVVDVPGLGRQPTFAAARRVRHAVTAWRADLIHLNLTDQGDGLALHAAAFRQRPLLATLHNVIPGRTGLRRALSAALLRRPDRVIAVSEAVGRYVTGCGGRMRVVLNGLDPATGLSRGEARRLLGLDPDALVIGGVGRLHHQKGWDVLGAAVAPLTAASQGVEFVVVGQGEQRGALQGTGLRLVGARPDAASLMAAFDVLVVPSRYEAFGLVALEAMHAGVPVVASAVDGLLEVLGDTGVLVRPEDPAALVQAVLELLADPAEREQVGRQGRARAAEHFTARAMVEGVQATYAEVLSGQR